MATRPGVADAAAGARTGRPNRSVRRGEGGGGDGARGAAGDRSRSDARGAAAGTSRPRPSARRRCVRRAPGAGRVERARRAARAPVLPGLRRRRPPPVPRLRRRLVAPRAAARGRDARRQKRRAVRELARSGATIAEINRLRTALSAVKGGRLGRATRARLATLVLSDVPGDRAALVGSGPTVRGPARGSRADRRLEPTRPRRGGARGEAARASRSCARRGVSTGRRASPGRRLARRARRLEPRNAAARGRRNDRRSLDRRSRGRGGRCLELALVGGARARGRPVDSASRRRLRRAGRQLRRGRGLRRRLDGRAGAPPRPRSGAGAGVHDTRAVFARLGDLFRRDRPARTWGTGSF